MLDERKEFKQYTADLKAADAPRRLRYDMITDSFASVPRAMTIVARGVLGGANDDKRIAFAKDCLRLWCGHAVLGDGEGDVHPAEAEDDRALQQKLSGWFPGYLTLLQKDKRSKGMNDNAEKLEKMKEQFAARGRRYGEAELDADRVERESDLRAITYESVIADAIDAGPLRKRYLVVTSGLDEQALFQGVTKNDTDASTQKARAKTVRTQILKITAIYLLSRRGNARGMVSIKASDADTYLQTSTAAKEKNESDLFSLMKLDGEPIFEKETLSNAISRLCVSEAWMERGGFVLAEEAELKKYPGKLYYCDGDWAEKHLVSGVVKA